MTDVLTEPNRPQQKSRRPWQFSLRTALVLMLVVGAGLGLWARHRRQEAISRNRAALIRPFTCKFEAPFRDAVGKSLHVLVLCTDSSHMKRMVPSVPEPDVSVTIVITDGYFQELTRAVGPGLIHLDSATLDSNSQRPILRIRGIDAGGHWETWQFGLARERITGIYARARQKTNSPKTPTIVGRHNPTGLSDRHVQPAHVEPLDRSHLFRDLEPPAVHPDWDDRFSF